MILIILIILFLQTTLGSVDLKAKICKPLKHEEKHLVDLELMIMEQVNINLIISLYRRTNRKYSHSDILTPELAIFYPTMNQGFVSGFWVL